MVEKICKLQRQLARRAEKLEFLEEHVRQLKQELQNKSRCAHELKMRNKSSHRIVQMYAVREDVGALTTRAMDANKVSVGKQSTYTYTEQMNDLITEVSAKSRTWDSVDVVLRAVFFSGHLMF